MLYPGDVIERTVESHAPKAYGYVGGRYVVKYCKSAAGIEYSVYTECGIRGASASNFKLVKHGELGDDNEYL